MKVLVLHEHRTSSKIATMTDFSCGGKYPYDSKREAMSDIWIRIEESAGGVVDLRAYKCKKCKKWHLTSRVK